jgi:hypothetical protein
MCTGEERLTIDGGSCFDQWTAASFDDKNLKAHGYIPYLWTVFAACWGANCLGLKAVSKLQMDAYCLRYIPMAVRKGFLEFIARCVEAEARERAAAQGEHIASYCATHIKQCVLQVLVAVCCSQLRHRSLSLVVIISPYCTDDARLRMSALTLPHVRMCRSV